MLKYYEVKNFLSYKSLTGFNLEKTNYQTLSDRNVRSNILKGLLFVGSNASGKSNSIYPVRLLLDLLFGKNEIDIIFYHCLLMVILSFSAAIMKRKSLRSLREISLTFHGLFRTRLFLTAFMQDMPAVYVL